MTYEGPKSIVFFHAYQAGSPDAYRYYQYQDKNDVHAVS